MVSESLAGEGTAYKPGFRVQGHVPNFMGSFHFGGHIDSSSEI
jgi:hypothetical protein